MKKVFLSTISLKVMPTLPYAVACIISHCLKDELISKNYEFLEPEFRFDCLEHKDFIEKLKETDILGLTCYVWNQVINDRISTLFKEINPNGIVIYGGPNVPEDKEYAEEYANDRKFVDLFFVGPGENTFSNFLKKYHETNDILNHEGSFTHKTNTVNLSRSSYKLDYLPTPYLDGILTNTLKKYQFLSAPIETNRGCPYKCSFCDWGGLTQSKLTQFDFEIVKKNIDELIKYPSVVDFNIIDANFGSFKRDVELIDYMKQKKIEYNKNLELHIMGMAKNGSKYVKEVYSKVHEFDVTHNKADVKTKLKNMKISFQTFTPEVLETIDRQNMTSDKLLDIIDRSQYKSVCSELIVGLPGETPDTWLDTLHKHIPLNLEFARVYHLYILPNAPMVKKSYKEKYKIKFTKLYVPSDLINTDYSELSKNYKNAGEIKTKLNIHDNKLEYEAFDIMSSCYSYNNDELKLMYLYHFWFNTFWNTGLLRNNIINHKLPLQEQAKLFFRLVEEGSMPFMSLIVNNYKKILDKIFTEDDVQVLDDLETTAFYTKNMGRGSELLYIVDNIEQFRDEITVIYPDFKIDDLVKFDNPRRRTLLSTQFVLLKE